MSIGRFFCIGFLLVLGLVSCEQKTTVTEPAATNSDTVDTLKIPKLAGLKPRLRLTEEAQKVTKNWKFYQDVSGIIDSLGQGTLKRTRALVTQLDQAYTNQAASIEADVNTRPSELVTQPINARLAALETQVKVLQNEVAKNEPDADRIALAIVKSKNALQNLNLQIDERFALSIEEMLKAANEEPDSLTTKRVLSSTLSN